MDAGPHRPSSLRIDRWLWAVRAFRTRELAAEACRNSRVTVNGSGAKPSRLLRAGDEVVIDRGGWSESLAVVAVEKRRVAAKRVPELAKDITPLEQISRRDEIREANRLASVGLRDGRPTKQERRQLEKFLKSIRPTES